MATTHEVGSVGAIADDGVLDPEPVCGVITHSLGDVGAQVCPTRVQSRRPETQPALRGTGFYCEVVAGNWLQPR